MFLFKPVRFFYGCLLVCESNFDFLKTNFTLLKGKVNTLLLYSSLHNLTFSFLFGELILVVATMVDRPSFFCYPRKGHPVPELTFYLICFTEDFLSWKSIVPFPHCGLLSAHWLLSLLPTGSAIALNSPIECQKNCCMWIQSRR